MIIKKKNKPKFILSKKEVFKAINNLNEISDIISYSFKTNPDVGNVLNDKKNNLKYNNKINKNNSTFNFLELNLKFPYLSIHSLNELKQVKENKNGNIWFFGMAWDFKELSIITKEYKIKNFVIDNISDLKTLLNYIKKEKIKINLLIRMKLKEHTIQTGKHYVFGINSEKVKQIILELEDNNYINNIGVHFHRKTQNVSEWSFKEEIIDALGEEIIKKISIVNIGGGLPGKYKNTNDNTIKFIFRKLKEFKKYLNKNNIKVIVEPGRYIASSAVKLETFIIAIEKNTLFLNCSIFNGSLDTVVANIKLLVEGELKNNSNTKNKYLLKGCTPDSTDILRYSVYLNKPKIGQKIIFLNCGAYTYQTNFCALDKIETKIVEEF